MPQPISPLTGATATPSSVRRDAPASRDAFAARLAAAMRPSRAASAPAPVTLADMVALLAGQRSTALAPPGMLGVEAGLGAGPAAALTSGGRAPTPGPATGLAGAPAAGATAPPGLPGSPERGGSPAVAAAQRYLGVPYRWGGTDPRTGLDCSGFVQRVFADLGVRLPRVSADQGRAGVAVPGLAAARPGDLLYWKGTNGRPNHIAVYAGDGRMIHAPRTGDVVRYANVRSAPPDAIRRVA